MQQCDVVCNRVTRLQHIRELSRFCKGRAASGLHAIQGKQTPGVRFAVRLSPDNKSLQCRHCRSAPDTDRLRGNHRARSPKDEASKHSGVCTQMLPLPAHLCVEGNFHRLGPHNLFTAVPGQPQICQFQQRSV